jgi:hypothetical protein
MFEQVVLLVKNTGTTFASTELVFRSFPDDVVLEPATTMTMKKRGRRPTTRTTSLDRSSAVTPRMTTRTTTPRRTSEGANPEADEPLPGQCHRDLDQRPGGPRHGPAGSCLVRPAPRALVAIVHGIGEHSGRYAALASDLVRARFTCVAARPARSRRDAGPRGDIPSWDKLRDQIVPAMFTATRGLPEQPAELPTVLFGHSMGGVIALDHALRIRER